ncbi:MAG: haloacid dehalogenase-like hydrolase [Candidatus Parcubacteria bacterium]|nr:haloacid dehalogenase-like hydrolase [Candidatus Parcubacteria bacterium]
MKKMIDLVQLPENVIIPNFERLADLLKIFKEQGKDKIHVLADFDRTLTKAIVAGQKMPSIISILRDGRFLTPEYAQKAHKLFDYYHPFEIDLNLGLADKKKKMEEWWRKHFELLLKSGLSKKEISEVAQDPRIQLRPGAEELLKELNQQKIPLVIMSSAGLGTESISLVLQREKSLYDNINIISNEFEYDQSGQAIKVKEPIIHTLNKDETMIQQFPAYQAVKNRPNVILLGDNLEDVGMVDGFDYDNLLRIGFLNENVDRNSEIYKKNFDVVIINDGGMEFINIILKEVI